MRARPLLLCALLALLTPMPVCAQEEDGPNFDIPEKWTAEKRETFNEAVRLYREAAEADEDSVTKFEAAITALLDALRLDKTYAPTRYYLGIAYQIIGEVNKARSHLELAVKYNKQFYEAMVELADTYMHEKKPKKAGRMYDKAVKTGPEYVHAYRMRALYLLKELDFAACAEDCEVVLTAEPEDELATYLRDTAQRELNGEDWENTYEAETEHYIVRTNTDEEFAELIGFRAEMIHKVYTRLFPKVSTGRRKFPIIVYADAEEYHRKGGPPSAGGHYEPLLRKLVLFRYPDIDDTMLVLQHEGFHQFLHYYLEDAPQWFNEGVADYFGPTEYSLVRGDDHMEVRPNPWRVKTIKQALGAGMVRGFRELMMMSQAELYHPQWAGIHYAQAWSIIYFLCEYNDREHFPILKDYFVALKEGDGQEAAFHASFGQVDLKTIEQEWAGFVRTLRED